MEILFLLIPVSILLGMVFLGLYILAVKTDQFEDLSSPASEILLDESEYIKLGEKKDE